MPEILRSGSGRSLVAALAALALGATACGGSTDEQTAAADGADTSTTASESTAAPESTDAPTTAPVDEADDDGDTDAPTTTPADEADEADDDGDTEVAPAENLFPDVDVVNIVDGSTLNLAAELGGGDRPVLLWFWAPH